MEFHPIHIRSDPDAEREARVRTLVRACIASTRGAFNSEPPLKVALKTWPDDEAIPLVLRASSEPPTNSANASALAQVTYAMVEALRSMSAGAELVGHGMQLSFGGAGQIIVPGVASVTSGFVKEMDPIPVRQAVASGPTLRGYKLAVICVLTSEMVFGGNAETFVRDAMINGVGTAFDAALFSNAAAVTGTRPAGLLNGVTATTASAATGGEAMIQDLAALAKAVAQYGGGSKIAFIAAVPQAIRINFSMLREVEQFPVLASLGLADGTVIAIAANALASVFETPQIDSSFEAAVHMEDSAPSPLDGLTATPIRSLYQTNSVGLRLRVPLDWGLRAPGAIAYMTGVKW